VSAIFDKTGKSVRRGVMGSKGKVGCGCLIFLLVICMVCVGIFIHPFTLKIIGKQLVYEDKIFPSDILFVPRFPEDRSGELYAEAFREFWAGNGKTIWIEDDRILGMSILDIVAKMAKSRGVPEGALKKLEVEGEGGAKIARVEAAFSKMGVKRVIIIVPEYASRRFHMTYGSSKDGAKVTYLIKPVSVSYFKRDRWWKESLSRGMLFREASCLVSYYTERFKHGGKEEDSKKR
jgi:hypothetical protein